MSPRRRRPAAPRGDERAAADRVAADFGPGEAPGRVTEPAASGPLPGLACGGEACVLKPAADLLARFAGTLSRRGHGASLARAALSGIELMRAFRDFLDEEIAFAENAARKDGAEKFRKIPVE